MRTRWFWPKLLFEPRDLWVGIYWNRQSTLVFERDFKYGSEIIIWDVYICLVPMLPLRLMWRRWTPNPD